MPIEAPTPVVFSRLIAMVDIPADTPPLTVEFEFTVEKHPDAMSEMGLISRDENIEIPNFIFSLDGQPASADDERDAIHGHKELINDGILRRNGCMAHHTAPHGHWVPIGIVQIADTKVGDLDVFETALENRQYYNDFEETLMEFMKEQDNVRCYRLEEQLNEQEQKDQHHEKWTKKRRKRRNRENRLRRKSPKGHGSRGRQGRHGSIRSLQSEPSSVRDETLNIREEMAFDEHRERGDIELTGPHSHALEEINELREADGEPSWQSVMNQNGPRMGKMSSNHDDMIAHRNTDTSPSKMTETMERRLSATADFPTNLSSKPVPMVETREGRGPMSYLSAVNATGMMAVAIAYIPYLPFWITVCMVVLTGMCVFGIFWVAREIKQRAISSGQQSSYQDWIPPLNYQNWIPPQLNAPRNAHMKSESGAPSQGIVVCESMDDVVSSDYYNMVSE